MNLTNQCEKNAEYHHCSYGPVFGGDHDLYLAYQYI